MNVVVVYNHFITACSTNRLYRSVQKPQVKFPGLYRSSVTQIMQTQTLFFIALRSEDNLYIIFNRIYVSTLIFVYF